MAFARLIVDIRASSQARFRPNESAPEPCILRANGAGSAPRHSPYGWREAPKYGGIQPNGSFRGTYINAFPVTMAETQPVTRIPAPRPASRRDLEKTHRTPLFLYDDAAWTAAEVAGQPRVDLGRNEHLLVHLFNLREALRARAREIGWDFWIAQGEMNSVRPGARETISPFITQSVLKMRAVWEGVQAQELLLVSSSSVRWLVDLPLTQANVQAVATGEHVLRRPGFNAGPPRGRRLSRSSWKFGDGGPGVIVTQ